MTTLSVLLLVTGPLQSLRHCTAHTGGCRLQTQCWMPPRPMRISHKQHMLFSSMSQMSHGSTGVLGATAWHRPLAPAFPRCWPVGQMPSTHTRPGSWFRPQLRRQSWCCFGQTPPPRCCFLSSTREGAPRASVVGSHSLARGVGGWLITAVGVHPGPAAEPADLTRDDPWPRPSPGTQADTHQATAPPLSQCLNKGI